MNRKVLALLLAGLVAFSLTACSKKDSAKIVEDDATTSTTEKSTTTTEEEDETTTTTASGLSPKIDLGGLGTSSQDEITPAQEECVDEGVADDPALSDYTSFAEIQAAPQADLEAFYTIFVQCVGPDLVIDLFMEGFASSGDVDDEGLACVRTIIEGLSGPEGVKLLAGDTAVTQAVTATIKSDCVL